MIAIQLLMQNLLHRKTEQAIFLALTCVLSNLHVIHTQFEI